MRVGSLCTGYGGLELSLKLAGVQFELAWVADSDPAASAVLALRHPDAPNLGDIKRIDWTGQPRIDLLAAGYPCQPFSSAGQRKGADDERHLWPHIFEGIRHLRPGLVLLENVAGHRSRGLKEVIADLAGVGYVGSWRSVRASDVGGAHKRERVFVLAWPAAADPTRNGHGDAGSALLAGFPAAAVAGDFEPVELLPTPWASPNENRSTKPTPTQLAGKHGRYLASEVCALFPTPRATDGTNGGPNQRGSKGDVALPAAVQSERWGKYSQAVARWEQVFGRPAPEPTEPGKTGPRLAPVFVEWLMGLEPGYVTGLGLTLTRNEQLRLLGNGVVPQQGAYAVTLLEHDRQAWSAPARTRVSELAGEMPGQSDIFEALAGLALGAAFASAGS